MKRREFLYLSTAGAVLLFSGCGEALTKSSKPQPLKNNALPIPPLLEGVEKNGVIHYDLTINKAKHSFFNGTLTNTYALNNQSYLGPTLKLEVGKEVSINFTNNLDEATTMHGHGMHVPAIMDGGVHQIIQPKQKWSARYTVKQYASTNWYHPHIMGKTAEHVYMGLAGLIIVEDSNSKSLNIPKDYGVDDIPLVLQDRKFTNAQLDYSPSRREIMQGYIGDTPLTNGAIEPFVEVENKEIRFRILNGSNASVYNLGFENGKSFKQIATDNAFLESPVTLTNLRLSPGERAEIIVDFSNDFGKSILFKDFNSNKKFLEVKVTKTATNITSTPNQLVTLTHLDPNNAQNTRRFTLDMSGRMGSMRLTINGKSMDKNRIDEHIPLNQVEIWEIENKMMINHNFHIHATHFEIIERNDKAPAPNERGYKDTVFLAGGDKVKLIVKMTDYQDAQNPYMYHCHFLEHEDNGMMGQFVVV